MLHSVRYPESDDHISTIVDELQQVGAKAAFSDELQRQLQVATSKFMGLEKENCELRHKLAMKDECTAGLEAKLSQLTSQLATARKASVAAELSETALVRDMQTRAETAAQQAERWKGQVDELRDEVRRLKGSKSALKATLSKASAERKEVEGTLQNKIAWLMEERSKMSQQYSSLAARLEGILERREDSGTHEMPAEVLSLQAALQQQQHKQHRVHQLEAALSAAKKQLAQSEAQREADKTTASKRVSDLEREVRSLQEEVKHKEHALQQYQVQELVESRLKEVTNITTRHSSEAAECRQKTLVATCEATIKSLEQRNHDLEEQLAELTEQAKADLSALSKQLRLSEERCRAAERDAAEQRLAAIACEKSVEVLEQKHEAMLESITLKNEAAELRWRLEKVQSSPPPDGRWEAMYGELKERLHSVEEAKSHVEAGKAQAERDLQELHGKYTALQTKCEGVVSALQDDKLRLQEEVERLEETCASEKSRRLEAETHFHGLVRTRDAAILSLREQLSIAQKRRKELEEQVDEADDAADRSLHDARDLKARLHASEEQCAELLEKLQQATVAQTEARAAAQEEHQLRVAVQHEAEGAERELQGALAVATQKQQEVCDAAKTLSVLREKAEEATKEATTARRGEEEAARRAATAEEALRKSENEVAGLQQQLAFANSQLTALQREAERLQESLRITKDEVVKERSTRSALQEQLRVERSVILETKRELSSLQLELEDHGAEDKAYKERIVRLHESLKECTEARAQAEASEAELKRALVDMEARAAAAEAAKEEMEKKLGDASERLQEMQRRVAAMGQEIALAHQRAAAADDARLAALGEKGRLAEHVQLLLPLRDQVDAVQKANRELEERCRIMEEWVAMRAGSEAFAQSELVRLRRELSRVHEATTVREKNPTNETLLHDTTLTDRRGDESSSVFMKESSKPPRRATWHRHSDSVTSEGVRPTTATTTAVGPASLDEPSDDVCPPIPRHSHRTSAHDDSCESLHEPAGSKQGGALRQVPYQYSRPDDSDAEVRPVFQAKPRDRGQSSRQPSPPTIAEGRRPLESSSHPKPHRPLPREARREEKRGTSHAKEAVEVPPSVAATQYTDSRPSASPTATLGAKKESVSPAEPPDPSPSEEPMEFQPHPSPSPSSTGSLTINAQLHQAIAEVLGAHHDPVFEPVQHTSIPPRIGKQGELSHPTPSVTFSPDAHPLSASARPPDPKRLSPSWGTTSLLVKSVGAKPSGMVDLLPQVKAVTPVTSASLLEESGLCVPKGSTGQPPSPSPAKATSSTVGDPCDQTLSKSVCSLRSSLKESRGAFIR